MDGRLRRAAAALNAETERRLALECRATGHRWPDRKPSDRDLGEADCCRPCSTTRRVEIQGDTKVYVYRFPAGYSPLR